MAAPADLGPWQAVQSAVLGPPMPSKLDQQDFPAH